MQCTKTCISCNRFVNFIFHYGFCFTLRVIYLFGRLVMFSTMGNPGKSLCFPLLVIKLISTYYYFSAMFSTNLVNRFCFPLQYFPFCFPLWVYPPCFTLWVMFYTMGVRSPVPVRRSVGRCMAYLPCYLERRRMAFLRPWLNDIFKVV